MFQLLTLCFVLFYSVQALPRCKTYAMANNVPRVVTDACSSKTNQNSCFASYEFTKAADGTITKPASICQWVPSVVPPYTGGSCRAMGDCMPECSVNNGSLQANNVCSQGTSTSCGKLYVVTGINPTTYQSCMWSNNKCINNPDGDCGAL